MNRKLNKDKILSVLKTVMDPELNISIVDLGLIYDISIKSSEVNIKMTLTTPACPLGNLIVTQTEEALHKIKGVKEVTVELVFSPAWTPKKMSPKDRKMLGYK